MNKIEVTTREQLDQLYKDSALTWEGLSVTDESLKQMFDWIKQHTQLKSETVYIIKGKLMNEQYRLTGSNAYDPELHIVCVKLSDMENYGSIVGPRFNVKARWFDDVVDNNAMREQRKLQ